MNDAFLHQAYCNLWSNHRLLTSCAQLSNAAFIAERTSFFPSICETLNHIYVVDLYYMDAMEGGMHGLATLDDETPYSSVKALQPAQHALDQRLVRLCESLDTARLNATVALEREDRIQIETTHRVLAHLFNHQIHHRGQVHAMLAGTATAPPQLDEFYLAGDAAKRQQELAELGLSESQIWGTEAESLPG